MFRSLLALTLAAFVLTGCGKTTTEERVAEGNQKVEELNQLAAHVRNTYSITLSYDTNQTALVSIYNKTTLNQFDEAELKKLKPLVGRYFDLVSDIVNLVNRADIKYSGKVSDLIAWKDNARSLKIEIDVQIALAATKKAKAIADQAAKDAEKAIEEAKASTAEAEATAAAAAAADAAN